MSRTDDELVALAAKAAGIDTRKPWNPLTNSGDAFDLAVKLWIRIEDAVYTHCDRNLCDYPDPYAATRRAIVCASAAIGEKLP